MYFLLRNLAIFAIAPCAGAWIEVADAGSLADNTSIAPCAGAWIEVSKHITLASLVLIAPCAGA